MKGLDNIKKHDARAKLIVNATEDILVYMEDNNISKAELAKRLGKNRSQITRLFNGENNLTMNTFSDICLAIGLTPEIVLVDSGLSPINYSSFRHKFINSDCAKKDGSWDNIPDNLIYADFSKNRKTVIKLNREVTGSQYAQA